MAEIFIGKKPKKRSKNNWEDDFTHQWFYCKKCTHYLPFSILKGLPRETEKDMLYEIYKKFKKHKCSSIY